MIPVNKYCYKYHYSVEKNLIQWLFSFLQLCYTKVQSEFRSASGVPVIETKGDVSS